jgi:AraC-like DNA-binding protein
MKIMFEGRLDNWFLSFQKKMFFYKDGFFQMPYLSNSPQIMVDCMIKMIISKHKPLERAIYSINPFLKGVMRYRELEEGFWLMAAYFHFTTNVTTKAVYDNGACEYYFLAFSSYKVQLPQINSADINFFLPINTWTLYKPGATNDASHYKGTKGLFYNFVFTEKWLKDNFLFIELLEDNFINDFFNSDSTSISFSDIVPNAVSKINSIWEILETENKGVFDIAYVKSESLDLINSFFITAKSRKKIGLANIESSVYFRNFIKVEKIIRENLTASFPGIESISKDVNMCSTKLKSSFKLVYGVSIMQYHKEMKMLLAKQLIENTSMYINEIASAVGYENASKFSASYKKQFGNLPSAKV